MLLVIWAVLFLSTTSEVSLGVCRDGHKLLTELSGQFSSRDDGFCTWLITVPKDLRIILYFESYNIDSTGYNLKCGIRIELKDSFDDQPWKTYCQSEMPQPVATNKSSLLVNFTLSESDDKSWFTAKYTTQQFEKKVDLGEVSGPEISSPMYPGRYPRNSYFKWSVVAPSGFRIKIQFTKVKMSRYNSDCREAHVMLLDGSSEESKVLDTICGERTVQPVYTSGNTLTVEFRSAVGESDYDGNGFKATLSKEAKLYLILPPCAAGILLVFVIVVAIVFMYRRRRLTLPSASRPRMQMSLLNDDDHISTTQISAEADPPNEANLPVYRPTTQAIKS